ncbi:MULTISPECIES: hypothetical protein [Streptomonospora]|uniref:Uncharacterized protein n=2 Tax=Streptomonospora TaxID=104204 RepID=A0ABV9SE63_9ACTN
MKFHLTTGLGFTAPDGLDTSENFDSFTDSVTDELFELEDVNENISDSDVAASLTDRTMNVSMVIEAETGNDAAMFFLNTVRTALHAAGGGTESWPEFKTTRGLTRDGIELADA